MTLDNSTGGIVATQTTWEVHQGTMLTSGANPLGGSTSVTLSGGTLDVTGEPVDLDAVTTHVTADSGLSLHSGSAATVGPVTFENGAVLSTSGPATTFNTAAVVGSGGVNNSNNLTIAAYNDNGATATFIKRGAGTMTVDNATAPGSIASAATNWRVEGGLMLSPGADPLGSAGSTVTLAGGTYRLAGPEVAVANDLRERYYFGHGTGQLSELGSGGGYLARDARVRRSVQCGQHEDAVLEQDHGSDSL